MCSYPASTAAASIASTSGCIERLSETASGPPTPWKASSPRSLSSARLKYGSTSSYDQPVAPSAAQSSKSSRWPRR